MNQFQNSKLNTLEYVRNYHSNFDSSNIIHHTLYHKYASSQNYYYTKEINDILNKNTTSVTIKFYDNMQYLDNNEYLSRFYNLVDYSSKIQLLVEFYKYHNDLLLYTVDDNILQIVNLYYDKKRKLDYYKIQSQIEYENQQNPDSPEKEIVGDKPIQSQSNPQSDINEDSSIKKNFENILQEFIMLQQDQNQLFQDDQTNEIQQMLQIFNSRSQIQKYSIQTNCSPSFKKPLKLNEQILKQSNRKQQQYEYRKPVSSRHPSSSLSRNLKTSQHEHNLDSNFTNLFNSSPKRLRATIYKKLILKKILNRLRMLVYKNQKDKKKQNIKSISSLGNKELNKILISAQQSTIYIKSFKCSTKSIKISKYQKTEEDEHLNSSPKNFQTIQTPRSYLKNSKQKFKQLQDSHQKDNILGLKNQRHLGMIIFSRLNLIQGLFQNLILILIINQILTPLVILLEIIMDSIQILVINQHQNVQLLDIK